MGPGVLTRIADAVGTPVWVYDAAHIRERYAALNAALAAVPHRLHYAVKANSNLAILRLLRTCGAGADIVSIGELERVMAAGFAPVDVIFSGVGKTPTEIEQALRAGVQVINVESESELRQVGRIAQDVGLRARVGLRVNPDVVADTHPYTQTGEKGVKFGIPWDEVEHLARFIVAHEAMTLVSLGVHLGSQIAEARPYAEGAKRLEDLIGAVRQAGVGALRHVDVGGGLAISYGQGEELSAEAFADVAVPLAERTGLELIVEPGRWLVGNAGALLTRVLYRKRAGGRELAIVDAGMNDLIRPSLYHAEHPIRVVGAGSQTDAADPVDVVGPICETGDFLGYGRSLGSVPEGALLAVEGAGAYGFSMSSNYNSRPRGAEVLLDGDRWGLIRARESLNDLWHGETVEPVWHE